MDSGFRKREKELAHVDIPNDATARATGGKAPAVSYAATGDALVDRILALIQTQPQILDLDSPWGLFRVPGFECSDLQPSLAQADWALAKAKAITKAEGRA